MESPIYISTVEITKFIKHTFHINLWFTREEILSMMISNRLSDDIYKTTFTYELSGDRNIIGNDDSLFLELLNQQKNEILENIKYESNLFVSTNRG